jgi:hypothetical protein
MKYQTEQYQAAHNAWAKMVDLKEGDSVKVISTATTGQHGWDNVWNPKMDAAVGKVMTVVRVGHTSGVVLSGKGVDTNYSYPFFILQKVETPLPAPIVISSNYKAEFRKDGSIKVGCQEISYDLLKAIYETAGKAKNS